MSKAKQIQNPHSEEEFLTIKGARVHNLKNINVELPRNSLIVITGLSGSGKSSLAFDTIYAEGQRRYMETFSAYARSFIGNMERPDVDKITGLSPVISIEQKTVNKNPRSTVGTITEVYDFLRLLYARASDAYSYETGELMRKFSEKQIVDLIVSSFDGKKITLLSPMVRARKGHYRELFEQIRKQGFLKVRIDGEIKDITLRMQVERYKTHDIETVIDTLVVDKSNTKRLTSSIQTALKHGKGIMMILDVEENKVRNFSKFLMCPTTGISYPDPEPNTFSFNSPYGACTKCNGLGTISDIDIKKIIPDDSVSIKNGGIAPLGAYKNNWIYRQIETLVEKYGHKLNEPIRDLPDELINTILYGSDDILNVKTEFAGTYSSYSAVYQGIISFIESQDMETSSATIRKWVSSFMLYKTCDKCDGTRLKKESIYFKIGDKNIAQLANMDIKTLKAWIDDVDKYFDDRKRSIAQGVLKEISTRLGFLSNIGIEYLNLNRSSQTLSGGEAQRIRLATQIGSQLVNVLYILDEPSIGLHQRDNERLIQSLKELRDLQNTIIVVEHDKDMMLAADYILDLGPGAGRKGGKVVAAGEPKDFKECDSLTCQYLTGKKNIEIPKKRRKGSGEKLKLVGAKGHNLKNLNVEFPLATLICVTGVSGSGKSSLINSTLYPYLNRHFYRSEKIILPCKTIEGLEHIDKVIEINQSPIGRTPRSNPATYIGIFDEVRKLFNSMPESKIRGYKPGRFSFNVKGGRCETCRGAGVQTIAMNFLPDVYVNCPDCNGKRYNRETLEIKYRGKSINDVLNLTMNQALEFFENIPIIRNKIQTVVDVGLGYITLGQQSNTLSGGEAQRVKLSEELAKRETGNTLYILDEPTTGLHFEDIRVLLEVLQKLVDRGNTVIVIEHNMDVIKVADHIIDLGPEGGDGGGEIVAEGTPEEIVKKAKGFTAKYLKDYI